MSWRINLTTREAAPDATYWRLDTVHIDVNRSVISVSFTKHSATDVAVAGDPDVAGSGQLEVAPDDLTSFIETYLLPALQAAGIVPAGVITKTASV